MATGDMLLIDCCAPDISIELFESARKGGLVGFRGKFQEAEATNKNGRSYPFQILDENRLRLDEIVKARKLLGELDHPSDTIVHLANASHLVTKLWWEGNALMGEGEILNTPSGKVLKSLLDDGVKFGISSRGIGNGVKNEEGILVIGESYRLITFDVVADPSTNDAFQERIVHGQYESVARAAWQERQKTHKAVVKNENTGIDTTGLLIAVMEGFVKSQTNKFKSRLKS